MNGRNQTMQIAGGQPPSRFGITSLVLGLALSTGCSSSGGGGSSTGTASAAQPAPAAAPTAQPKTTTAAAPGGGPKDAKGVNLANVLGTKSDGWVLPPFAKLKDGMTPAEAGRVLRGADKIDNFGFAEVKVTGVRGVASYYLSFLDDKGKRRLAFAAVRFDPKLTDEPFWNALVDHMKNKLGADMKVNGDKNIMWINNSLLHLELSKGITHDGYEVQTSLSK